MNASQEDLGGGASLSTEPAFGSSSATDISLREVGGIEERWLLRWLAERDRRYAEVQDERNKAEVLRAANQAYRDEKANELREQLSRERIEYASKADLKAAIETITATLKPIVEFVAAQQGLRQGGLDQRLVISWVVGLVAVAVTIVLAFNN